MKQLAFFVIALFAACGFCAGETCRQGRGDETEPVKEAAKPAPAKSAASRKAGRRWNEDARHCLEKASNTEVIKCAEEYL